jgi:hypothetical protein
MPMDSNVVKFPFTASRRAFARKPRWSKNGTPEERAEAAARGTATPAAAAPQLEFSQDRPALIQGDDDAYLARTLFSETFWTLPFVTMPAGECGSWGEFWKQVVMWNDEPTDNSVADYHRGRRYAYLAIDAIQKDNTGRCQLEITVDRMLEGAFRRRGPSGKLCRAISEAEKGFIAALCLAAVRPNDMKAEAKREGWL